jgi:hypothetical protein
MDAPHDRPGGAPARPVETVVVHGEGVRVDRAHVDLPRAEVHSRFGGLDPAAVVVGALAGLGTALLLGAVAGGLGLRTTTLDDGELAVAGALVALLAAVVAAAVAGWTAGRTARYDGARNGLLAGVLLVLLLVVLGAAGAAAAVDGGLPVTLDGEELTAGAAVTALLALLLAAAVGALAGRAGAAWHRRVDDVVAGTRAGAVVVPPGTTEVVR